MADCLTSIHPAPTVHLQGYRSSLRPGQVTASSPGHWHAPPGCRQAPQSPVQEGHSSSHQPKCQPGPVGVGAQQLHKGGDVEQVVVIAQNTASLQVSTSINQLASRVVVRCCRRAGGQARLALLGAWGWQLDRACCCLLCVVLLVREEAAMGCSEKEGCRRRHCAVHS